MSKLSSLFHLTIGHWPLYRHIRNRRRFPGLAIDPSANLSVDGPLRYGRGCSIGMHSQVYVFKDGCLELGENCYIGRNVEIGADSRIKLGSHVSLQDRTIILGKVSIGSHTLFAPDVYISSGNHNYRFEPPMLIRDQDRAVARQKPDGFPIHRPVVIGEDCWIGKNVVILQGVTIGRGCVVGANSVVRDSLPPYSVAAGAPARILRRRLGFEPPSQISSERLEDRPYFYSGCLTSESDLERSLPLGGIVTEARFVLALRKQGAGALRLVARALDSEEVSLCYGGEPRRLGNRFEPVAWAIGENDGLFELEVLPDASPGGIVIAEAALQ